MTGEATTLDELEVRALARLTEHRIEAALAEGGFDEARVVGHLLGALRAEVGEAVALEPDAYELLWGLVEESVAARVRARLESTRLDPERYYRELAEAFFRGRLPEAEAPLLEAARAAELRWYKFKRKSGLPRVSAVLSLLEGLQPRSLLDIGSGRGAFLWPLLDRFPTLEVCAVDALEHRVRDIEAVRLGGVCRLRGLLGDVTRLPFEDGAFDIVTILEVLEHLERPAAAAAEVLRVADRAVLMSVPSKPDDNPEHIQLFTPESLTELFLGAGAARVQLSFVRGHIVAHVHLPSG